MERVDLAEGQREIASECDALITNPSFSRSLDRSDLEINGTTVMHNRFQSAPSPAILRFNILWQAINRIEVILSSIGRAAIKIRRQWVELRQFLRECPSDQGNIQ